MRYVDAIADEMQAEAEIIAAVKGVHINKAMVIAGLFTLDCMFRADDPLRPHRQAALSRIQRREERGME